MDGKPDFVEGSAQSRGRVDRVFGLAFESLHKRWNRTTDSDDTERQEIIDELRRITVDWQQVLDARARAQTRASADAEEL